MMKYDWEKEARSMFNINDLNADLPEGFEVMGIIVAKIEYGDGEACIVANPQFETEGCVVTADLWNDAKNDADDLRKKAFAV